MIIKLSKVKILKDTKILDKLKTVSTLTPERKWVLTKFIKKINEEFEDLEVVRVDLVKRFGDTTEEGFSVPDSKMDEFLREMQTVLSKEVEVPEFRFSPSEVGEFSIDEMLLMDDLIQD